jgi:hypothetical protein
MTEPRRISNSKANVYLTCPKQFHFKYIRHLRPIKEPIPLYRGTWLHALIEHHYLGEDWRIEHRRRTATFMAMFEEEREDYGDLPTQIAHLMSSYVKHYKEEDRHFTVIAAELDELVPLPDGTLFQFVIDLIIKEEDGGIWLMDHKSISSQAPDDFLLLDAQLARYTWAAHKLGYKVRGVMLNEITTKAPTLPKVLKTGGLEQRRNIVCDEYSYRQAIIDNGFKIEDYAEFLEFLGTQSYRWFKRTRLPRDVPMIRTVMRELMMVNLSIKDAARRNHYPRAVTKQCSWCPFVSACVAEMQGAESDDVLRLKFTTAKHEKELENIPVKLKKKPQRRAT